MRLKRILVEPMKRLGLVVCWLVGGRGAGGGARAVWGRGQDRSLLIGSWIVPLGDPGNTSVRGGVCLVWLASANCPTCSCLKDVPPPGVLWLAVTGRFEIRPLWHHRWACPPRCVRDTWATLATGPHRGGQGWWTDPASYTHHRWTRPLVMS